MYKQPIEDFFNKHTSEMISDICRLISIPSDKQPAQPGEPFGPGAAAALAEALEMARDMGFAVKNYDNYVGTADLGDGPAGLDILAHLDVVPAGEGWTVTAPFEPRIHEGRIYGRGASDDKGPAVAALYAMRAVRELGVPLKGRVRLILGTDEECGSSDIDRYYAEEPEAPMTFSPDADFPVINIEKGRLAGDLSAEWPEEMALPRLVAFCGGIKINVVPSSAEAILEGLTPAEVAAQVSAAADRTGIQFTTSAEDNRLLIRASGKSEHAAEPDGGNNAITGLLDLLASLPLADSAAKRRLAGLNRLFPHGDWLGRALGVDQKDELSGELTLSLDLLEISTTGLQGAFDCRAPICASDASLRDIVERRLSEHGIRLSDRPMTPPHHVPADLPFIQTLLSAYEEYSGKPGRCLAIGGGTYVHGLQRGVAFGCTELDDDCHLHGPDEFADIAQLVMSAKIFTKVIIELMKDE